MKRVLSVLLVVCMLLCVCACGEKSTASKTTKKIKDEYAGEFRVGYGREIIMPEFGVPLGGYGSTEKRISTGYLDKLTTSCTAISDEKGNTVLLFANDIISTGETTIGMWRNAITKATGVKQDNIMFTASHTHSGPDTANTKVGTIVEFNNKFQAMVVSAAVKALNDRKPAKIYYGKIETDKLTFVRHYFGDDGTALGNNHYLVGFTGKIVRHASEGDENLYLLKFEREGAKDVYYTNFRCHPTMTGGTNEPNISADFVGQYRKMVEEELDCYCSYYQGAAGNMAPGSQIEEENPNYDYIEEGTKLAEYAIEASKNMVAVDSGEIKVAKKNTSGKINHSQDNLVPAAQLVVAKWNETYDSNVSQKYAQSLGLASQYHANAIINKSKMSASAEFTIYAISFGKDLAITYIPFEQFDTNSSYIIKNSPFKYTLPQGYSNGSDSYLPSKEAFEYDCYESNICKFASGTAEEVTDNLLTMLKGLKK